MASVNEKLRDDAISHDVDLQQYANHVVARMIALLNRTDADLFAQLTEALEQVTPATFNVDRLTQLLASVRALNASAYQQLGRELTDTLKEFVDYEAGYQLNLFRSAIPAEAQVILQLDIATVSVEQVYAAAMARPFQGRLLKGWIEGVRDELSNKESPGLADQKIARIRDAVAIGYAENQTTAEIVKRIRGTKARKYEDGIINIDRHRAETVVRTAISHTAAFTRNRFLDANKDLIKAVVWTSTLDARTSEPCRLRDGLKYTPEEHKPIGHKVPWLSGPGQLHWNCRSTSVPVTKSWAELGGVDIGEFNPATRASMDGQVPAETTFADWIKKQSAARQDEILGPTRGKLMREGGLNLDRFYNERGRYLDLKTLRQRDAAAFAAAGL